VSIKSLHKNKFLPFHDTKFTAALSCCQSIPIPIPTDIHPERNVQVHTVLSNPF